MSWLDYISSRSQKFSAGRGKKEDPTSKQATVVSFIMCKGGVGKTTSTRLISEEIAQLGYRVLMVDTDPQGNLTLSFRLHKLGFTVDENTPVLADILSQQAELSETIMRIAPNLSLIPSTAINALSDKIMERKKVSVKLLRKKIQPLLSQFDFILFDTAPTLSLVNASIILGSDLVVLPVCLDEFSRNGLLQTLQEVDNLKKSFSSQVKPRILINRFSEDKLSQYYLAFYVQNHSDLLLNTVVRDCADIRERVIAEGTSLADTDYKALAKEILKLREFEVDLNA